MGVLYDKILGKMRDGENLSGYAEVTHTPQILSVADIQQLSSEQLAALKMADFVIDEATHTTYIVSLIRENEDNDVVMELTGHEADNIIVHTFTKSGGMWSWTGRKTPLYTVLLQGDEDDRNHIEPNSVYDFGELDGDVVFKIVVPDRPNRVYRYHWIFSTGVTAPNITWPAEIVEWEGGGAPFIEQGKHYEIILLNGFAVCLSNAPAWPANKIELIDTTDPSKVYAVQVTNGQLTCTLVQ